MILGVHHAALAVPSMEEALAFYCNVLGFEVVVEAEVPSGFDPMCEALGTEDSGFKVRMIRKGNSCIELFEFAVSKEGEALRPPNRIGLTHIALASDDISADYERLAENGVNFNAALFGAAPSRFAYGRDPFGNVIELLEHNPASKDALSFA